MTWTMRACSRSRRRLRGAWRRSCNTPGRSRWWQFARSERWTLPAELIDGAAVALKIRTAVALSTDALVARGVRPGLSVVLVGDDPASAVYVRSKERACLAAGMRGETIRLPASTTEVEL